MKHYGGMLIPAGKGRLKRSSNKGERTYGCGCEYCWQFAGFPSGRGTRKKPRSWKRHRQHQRRAA